MAELGTEVAVVEIIRTAKDVTLRFHAEKQYSQKRFPVDTTVIFKDGKLTTDQDELPIPEAI